MPATAEALQTLGITLLGWRTDELPLFYTSGGGPPVSARVDAVEEAARVASAHWQLRGESALVLAQPPAESVDDVEPLLERALASAAERGIAGQALTPFVLSFVHEASGGRTLSVNRELVTANAGLAARVASAYAQLS